MKRTVRIDRRSGGQPAGLAVDYDRFAVLSVTSTPEGVGFRSLRVDRFHPDSSRSGFAPMDRAGSLPTGRPDRPTDFLQLDNNNPVRDSPLAVHTSRPVRRGLHGHPISNPNHDDSDPLLHRLHR